MKRSSVISQRRAVAVASALLLAFAFCAFTAPAIADDGPPPLPPNLQAQAWGQCDDVRYGGVLAESYAYHQQMGQPKSIAPPGGAYQYGFPVQTYRWGWFGAQHYYPYVVWHRGYNGDCVRWAYRRGY